MIMRRSSTNNRRRGSKRRRLTLQSGGTDGPPVPDHVPSCPIPDPVTSTAGPATAATAAAARNRVPFSPRRSPRVAALISSSGDTSSSQSSTDSSVDGPAPAGTVAELEWDVGAAVNDGTLDEEDEDEEDEEDEEDDIASAEGEVMNGNVEMPTLQELSGALRILDIGVSAAGPAVSRGATLKALGRLYNWADVADVEFLRNFHSLGGIRKVLEVLVWSYESDDRDGVSKAASVLGECLFFDERVLEPEMGACIRDMARMLVQVNGVENLIRALSTPGGNQSGPAAGGAAAGYEVELYIWMTLRNVTYLDAARGEMRKGQKLQVLDAALAALQWLTTAPHDDRHHHRTLEFTLTTLTNLLERPGRLTGREYKAKGTLAKGLKALKPYSNKWQNHEDLAQSAVVFLGCYLDYKEGDRYDAPFDRSLFSNSDYRGAITICVKCLKYFLSNGLVVDWAFWMLKKSCQGVGNDTMEALGVVEIAGAILKSARAPAFAKKDARELLKELYRT